MRKSSSVRKIFILLALLALALPLGLFAGAHAVRALLISVFTKGTGCNVSLGSAAIHLIPFTGEVKDVEIRCAGEKEEQGFFADRVTTSIRLADLLAKRVSLRGLVVEGAHAVSASGDSAFMRTMDFIISDSPPEPPAWHDFITAHWKAAVDTVHVHGKRGAVPELRLMFGDKGVSASAVEVFFEDRGKLPSPLVASAENSDFTTGPRRLPLGKLSLNSMVGGKIFDFKELTLRPPGSEISGQGKILLGAHPEDDLTIEARLSPDYVTANLTQFSDVLQDAELRLKGVLRGDFRAPTFKGNIKLDRQKSTALSTARCIAPVVSSDFELGPKVVELTTLNLGALHTAGGIRAELTGDMPFSVDLRAELASGYQEAVECLSVSSDAEDPRAAELRKLFSEALGGSTLSLQGTGRLEPLQASLTAQSVLYAGSNEDRSVLSAKLAITPTGFSAEFFEDIGAHAARALSGSFSYDIVRRSLNVASLEFESYPAVRVLARAAVFLPRAALGAVYQFLTSETVLNGKLSGIVAPGTSAGGGSLGLERIVLPGNEAGSLSWRVAFDGDKVRLSDILLLSSADPLPALRAEGQAEMKTDGELNGRLNLNRFDLAALPSFSEKLPALNGILGGQLRLSGTVSQPAYSGELSIDSPLPGGDVGVLRSDFKLQGDTRALALDGVLFNARGSLNLHLPFDEAAMLSLSLHTADLPLSFIMAAERRFETAPDLAGEPQDVVNLANSLISLQFEFSGPTRDPLRGSGKLEIERFKLVGTELELSQRSPLQMRIQNGRVLFDSVALLANKHELRLTGYADRSSGWNAAVEGRWEISQVLAGLEMFNDFDHLSGLADARVHISGPLKAPSLNGALNLKNGSFALAAGQGVVGASAVEIQSTFRGTDFVIERLSARVGDGHVTGSGKFANVIDAPDGQLNLEFSEIVLEPVERFVVSLGGEIALAKHKAESFSVEGLIKLDEGSYENTIDLVRMIQSITRTVIGVNTARAERATVRARGRTSAGTGAPELRLRIETESPIVIETNVLEAALRVELLAEGPAVEPRLKGMIEATDGTFGLQSNTFELVSGQIIFSESSAEINPRLNIAGESTIEGARGEEHRVRMTVKGTLQKPVVSFSSDTGLPENQIVGMLGRGGKGGAGFTVLKDSGAQYGLIELLNPISNVPLRERFSGLTGFTEVQLDPAFSSSTGEFTPRVIAKRPLPKELNLRLTSELTGQQASEARVEYPLTFQTNLFAGWKNSTATNSAQGSGGAMGVGLRYSTTFPGISLLPKKMEEEEK